MSKNYKIKNHTLVDQIRHQCQCRFVLVAGEGNYLVELFGTDLWMLCFLQFDLSTQFGITI